MLSSVEARQPSANLRAHGADAAHRPGRERHKWHEAGRRGPHLTPAIAFWFVETRPPIPTACSTPDGRFLRDVLPDTGVASRLGVVLPSAEIPWQRRAAVRRSRRSRRRISPPAIALGQVSRCGEQRGIGRAQAHLKSVVRRDVIRLVTPGTLTEDTLLPAAAAICSRWPGRNCRQPERMPGSRWPDRYIDRRIRVTECDRASLSAEIAWSSQVRSSSPTRCSAKPTSPAIGARFPP